MHEDIPIFNLHGAEGIHPRQRQAHRRRCSRRSKAARDADGRRNLIPTGEPDEHSRLRRRSGRSRPGKRVSLDRARLRHRLRQMGHAEGRCKTFASTNPKVFFGGDAAFGPRTSSGRWRTAMRRRSRSTGSAAARTSPCGRRTMMKVISQKMGIHEWSYDNEIRSTSVIGCRTARRWSRCATSRPRSSSAMSRSGLEGSRALPELRRADRVHGPALHRVRRLRRHLPDGLHHLHANGEEAELRSRLEAPANNLTQDLYIGNSLKTGRVMVKDEDVCLHCGLCAERCPPERGTCRNISSK